MPSAKGRAAPGMARLALGPARIGPISRTSLQEVGAHTCRIEQPRPAGRQVPRATSRGRGWRDRLATTAAGRLVEGMHDLARLEAGLAGDRDGGAGEHGGGEVFEHETAGVGQRGARLRRREGALPPGAFVASEQRERARLPRRGQQDLSPAAVETVDPAFAGSGPTWKGRAGLKAAEG